MKKLIIISLFILLTITGCTKVGKTVVKSLDDDGASIIRKSISLNDISFLFNKNKIIRSSFFDDNAEWIFKNLDNKTTKKLINATHNDPYLLNFCNTNINNLKFWKSISLSNIDLDGIRIKQIYELLLNNKGFSTKIDSYGKLKIFSEELELATILDNNIIKVTRNNTNGIKINSLLYKHNLLPNSIYYVGDTKYYLDNLKRTKRFEIQTVNITTKRPPRDYGLNNKSKFFHSNNDGLEGDERGHMLGRMLDGDDGGINLFSQSHSSNRMQLNYVEKPIQKFKEEGKSVTNLKGEYIYDGDSLRPSSCIYSFEVDGFKQDSILIQNIKEVLKSAS